MVKSRSFFMSCRTPRVPAPYGLLSAFQTRTWQSWPICSSSGTSILRTHSTFLAAPTCSPLPRKKAFGTRLCPLIGQPFTAEANTATATTVADECGAFCPSPLNPCCLTLMTISRTLLYVRRIYTFSCFMFFNTDIFPTDPTTVAAARPVDVPFFASVLRDFYNGTKYDMAADGNLAAGPWGDPDRYGTWSSPVKGSWERSIGVYRTAYAHITQVCHIYFALAMLGFPFGTARLLFPKPINFALKQANNQLKGSLKGLGGITWFASDKPSTSVFLPLLVAPLPVAFSIGQPSVMDKKAAYWLFRCVFINIPHNYCAVRLPCCSLTVCPQICLEHCTHQVSVHDERSARLSARSRVCGRFSHRSSSIRRRGQKRSSGDSRPCQRGASKMERTAR